MAIYPFQWDLTVYTNCCKAFNQLWSLDKTIELKEMNDAVTYFPPIWHWHSWDCVNMRMMEIHLVRLAYKWLPLARELCPRPQLREHRGER